MAEPKIVPTMVVTFDSLRLLPTGTTDGSVAAGEVADAAKEADEVVFGETTAVVAVDTVDELKHEVSETTTANGSDGVTSTTSERPVKMYCPLFGILTLHRADFTDG